MRRLILGTFLLGTWAPACKDGNSQGGMFGEGSGDGLGDGGSGDDGSDGAGDTGTGGGDDGGDGDGVVCTDPPAPSDETPDTCGNGDKDTFEQCDCGGESCLGNASGLGNKTCLDFCSPSGAGYIDGILECDANCNFDLSACVYCGDGIRGGIEECDGADVGDATCLDAGYPSGGALACNDDCTYDTSACEGPACGDHTPPAGGSCPAACTTCMDTTCVITCAEDDGCEDLTIDCPAGFDCRVECTAGDDACKMGTINCPADGACDIICDGTDACEDATVTCGGGPCNVDCSAAMDACCGLQIGCGLQACAATCTGIMDPDEMPAVECGQACSCTTC